MYGTDPLSIVVIFYRIGNAIKATDRAQDQLELAKAKTVIAKHYHSFKQNLSGENYGTSYLLDLPEWRKKFDEYCQAEASFRRLTAKLEENAKAWKEAADFLRKKDFPIDRNNETYTTLEIYRLEKAMKAAKKSGDEPAFKLAEAQYLVARFQDDARTYYNSHHFIIEVSKQTPNSEQHLALITQAKTEEAEALSEQHRALITQAETEEAEARKERNRARRNLFCLFGIALSIGIGLPLPFSMIVLSTILFNSSLAPFIVNEMIGIREDREELDKIATRIAAINKEIEKGENGALTQEKEKLTQKQAELHKTLKSRYTDIAVLTTTFLVFAAAAACSVFCPPASIVLFGVGAALMSGSIAWGAIQKFVLSPKSRTADVLFKASSGAPPHSDITASSDGEADENKGLLAKPD
ncbi:MAG: hypothetical protein EBX40_02740 [Gammaproteobacteria bacterium]|nr:hypothetical protein [Gammaproteobacteria bacterium]